MFLEWLPEAMPSPEKTTGSPSSRSHPSTKHKTRRSRTTKTKPKTTKWLSVPSKTYHDREYYYNPETDESTWTVPEHHHHDDDEPPNLIDCVHSASEDSGGSGDRSLEEPDEGRSPPQSVPRSVETNPVDVGASDGIWVGRCGRLVLCLLASWAILLTLPEYRPLFVETVVESPDIGVDLSLAAFTLGALTAQEEEQVSHDCMETAASPTWEEGLVDNNGTFPSQVDHPLTEDNSKEATPTRDVVEYGEDSESLKWDEHGEDDRSKRQSDYTQPASASNVEDDDIILAEDFPRDVAEEKDAVVECCDEMGSLRNDEPAPQDVGLLELDTAEDTPHSSVPMDQDLESKESGSIEAAPRSGVQQDVGTDDGQMEQGRGEICVTTCTNVTCPQEHAGPTFSNVPTQVGQDMLEWLQAHLGHVEIEIEMGPDSNIILRNKGSRNIKSKAVRKRRNPLCFVPFVNLALKKCRGWPNFDAERFVQGILL